MPVEDQDDLPADFKEVLSEMGYEPSMLKSLNQQDKNLLVSNLRGVSNRWNNDVSGLEQNDPKHVQVADFYQPEIEQHFRSFGIDPGAGEENMPLRQNIQSVMERLAASEKGAVSQSDINTRPQLNFGEKPLERQVDLGGDTSLYDAWANKAKAQGPKLTLPSGYKKMMRGN